MMSLRKTILSNFLEDIWNRGLEDKLSEYLGPEYVIHHDPGDAWHGKTLDIDGFRQRLLVSRAPFPDQRFDIQDMLEDGDKIAISWLWQATHVGELAGIPATGRVIHMSGLTIYSFSGDRLSGHWQMVDRLGVFQQLSAS